MAKNQLAHTIDDKRDAAAAFVLTGTMKDVANATGVPVKTLYRWAKAPWWKEMLEEAKWEHQEVIEGRLSNIIDKATIELLDRLYNGDRKQVYNRDSREYEEIRVPMEGKELARTVEKLGNQLRTIRNQPTKLVAEAKFDATEIIKSFQKVAQENRGRIVSEQ